MKAKLTYKSGADVLSLDDTSHKVFPTENETISINGRDYVVDGIESAVILVTPVPEEDRVESPNRSQSRARTERRLSAERQSERQAGRPWVRITPRGAQPGTRAHADANRNVSNAGNRVARRTNNTQHSVTTKKKK